MNQILIIDKIVKFAEIKNQVSWHSDYIKGVADLKNKRLSLGGDLHADGEQQLLENLDVENEFLWGFNLYPDQSIEFESLINIKPKTGNKSIIIAKLEIRESVQNLILSLIHF